MAEGSVWNCNPQFSDCGKLVLAYGGQVDVCAVLQEEQASIYKHCSRLECMDITHLLDECGGVCIGSRRADFQLSDWDRGKSIRELVYIWVGGCVLAI